MSFLRQVTIVSSFGCPGDEACCKAIRPIIVLSIASLRSMSRMPIVAGMRSGSDNSDVERNADISETRVTFNLPNSSVP